MIPRVCFANLPTPIEAMPRLSAYLGGPRLWVKRDDLTGPAFGGNKTRKLEFVIAEAQANGARTLVTVGGIQSNHCRQTAAIAAKMGMKCILVLSGEEPSMYTGNLFIDSLLGAEVVWCHKNEREEVLKRTFEKSWVDGERPYLIPLGASTPTGALGYEAAFREMIDQNVVIPDWIIIPSSSGGTQAGLVLGAHLFGFKGRILGISIDHPEGELCAKVAQIACGASERLGVRKQITPGDVLVNADYLGGGYGVLGAIEAEAIHLFARLEGLLLCPVYTSRAAAGMIDLIRKGFFKKDENILFWHTGGDATLFADPYEKQLQSEYHYKPDTLPLA